MDRGASKLTKSSSEGPGRRRKHAPLGPCFSPWWIARALSPKACLAYQCPPALLLEPLPLQEGPVVLEVLEDTVPGPPLADALAVQRAQGYALALDDFALAPEWTPYLDQFSYLKLEVPRLRLKQDWALPPSPRAQWIGEKVETIATLRRSAAEWPCSRVISSPFPSLLAPNLCPSGPAPFCNCLVFWNTRRRIFALARIAGADPTLTVRLLRAAGAVAATAASA